MLKGKDFYVITTNQDTQFVKMYPQHKVSELQGDHRFFQCACCCTDDIWDAVKPVAAIDADTLEIPSDLVPRWPHCGGEAFPWVRGYGNFLQGMGAKWPTETLYWAFGNRLYQRYVKSYEPGPIMARLKDIVGDRPYCIITSNGEAHFERAGFNAQQIWAIEGQWTMMQCGLAYHNELYSAEPAFSAMAAYTDEMLAPEGVLPQCPYCECPYCGGTMRIYSAFEPKFVTNQAAYV